MNKYEEGRLNAIKKYQEAYDASKKQSAAFLQNTFESATQEPATLKQEPATQEQEPATQEQEPATQEQEPATQEQEPATQEQEPAAKLIIPVQIRKRLTRFEINSIQTSARVKASKRTLNKFNNDHSLADEKPRRKLKDKKNVIVQGLDTNAVDTNAVDTNAVDTNAVDTKAKASKAVKNVADKKTKRKTKNEIVEAVDTNAVDTNAVDTNAVDTNAVDTNAIDCPICVKAIKKSVICAKCSQASCHQCFQEYLLNSTLTPTCMFCKMSLSDDFVIDNTTLSWRTNKYKLYKENTLFDMERARLPDTQTNAEIYLNAIKIVTPNLANIVKLREELVNIYTMLNENRFNNYYKRYTDAIKDSKKIHKQLRSLLRTNRIYTPFIRTFGLHQDGTEVAATVKRVVVKACPTTDCSGFLNDEFVCGLCSTHVCKKCHEVITEKQYELQKLNKEKREALSDIESALIHECNNDTVETIKALKAEAKNCPQCATLISKIDGCDQMWCTQCHSTFSWRTGLLEKGHTHNPHYYEWMRKNGGMPRAPGDEPTAAAAAAAAPVCGFPTLAQFINIFTNEELAVTGNKDAAYYHYYRPRTYRTMTAPNLGDNRLNTISVLIDYHRRLTHLEITYREALNITPPDNHILRVKLLAKEITDTKMRITLQQRDKAYRKNLAKNQIYQMVYTVAGDIYREVIRSGDIDLAKTSIDALFTYANECLDKLAVGYSCQLERYAVV